MFEINKNDIEYSNPEIEIDIEDPSLFIEVVDPNLNERIDQVISGLLQILPGENAEEIILLNKLKLESGIVKIAAKHKPNNPKLWAKCIAAAKKKFKVFPSAYSNSFAAKLYKKKGGTWRTVKKGK